MLTSSRSAWSRYGLAAIVLVAAVALRLALDPWAGGHAPFATLFLGILVVAAFAGRGPALLVTILGAVAGAYLFLAPRYSLAIGDVGDRIRLGLYVVVGAGIAVLGGGLREALRRSEAARSAAAREHEQLRITLASVADAVVVVDPGGLVVSLNPAAERLTGWAAAAAVGAPLGSVCRILDRSTRRELAAPAPGGAAGARPDDAILVARDGREHLVDHSASAFRLADGSVAGTVLVCRDVTPRRRVALEMERGERRLRVALDAARMVAWDWAPADGTLRTSENAAEVYGLPAGSSLTTIAGGLALVHPDDVAAYRAAYERAVAATGAYLLQYRLVRPDDGRVLWMEERGYVLAAPGDGGDGPRLSGVTMDITERKRAEEDLRRLAADLSDADRRKDEFLATLAHELRSPLASIRNALQVVRLADGDPAAAVEARQRAERQVAHMVRLIDDLLDVSRIAQGKLELRRERADLAAIVANAVDTSRPLVEAARHQLAVSLPDRLVVVDADPTRLAQVFANLINNAAKYTEPGGNLAIVAEQRGGEVVVTVRDDGVGIPPDQLGSVFGLFTQVDGSTGRSQGGLGIGLTLVRRLVEMHGGTVEARSDGRGRGSEFIVRLPIVGPPAPAGTPGAAGGPAAHRRILVVDDHRDSARTLASLLRLMDNDVRVAHDGGEAVEVAEAYRPEVILLDIGMPVMNGYEVAAAIREQPWGAAVIIIALTGWGQDRDRRRAGDVGFDHHLVKPVDLADLEDILAGLDPAPPAPPAEAGS